MLIKEYEITENYTDEEEKDFREFLKKNINKKSTKWLGVEVYEGNIDLENSILFLRNIFGIINEYKKEMNLSLAITCKGTIEDSSPKMKIKLFDQEPKIVSNIIC